MVEVGVPEFGHTLTPSFLLFPSPLIFTERFEAHRPLGVEPMHIGYDGQYGVEESGRERHPLVDRHRVMPRHLDVQKISALHVAYAGPTLVFVGVYELIAREQEPRSDRFRWGSVDGIMEGDSESQAQGNVLVSN